MRSVLPVLVVSLWACSDHSVAPAPVPAKVEKVAAPTPGAPAVPAAPKESPEVPAAAGPHCRGVRMPRDLLCKCLDRVDSPATSCEVQPVDGGFGILKRDGEITVVHDDHGLLPIGTLYGPGMDSFDILGTHVVTLANKPVLWVDAYNEWDEGNNTKLVYLCPAREPAVTELARQCVRIPVEEMSQAEEEGTHSPIGPIVRTRYSISFTPKGEVVVRPVGKGARLPKELTGKLKVE